MRGVKFVGRNILRREVKYLFFISLLFPRGVLKYNMQNYNYAKKGNSEMEKRYFGTLPSGDAVSVYTIANENITLEVLDRGCVIKSLIFNGVDTVRGFDTLESYLADTSHQGAVIGRVANRVAGARFVMDGKEYNLPKNDGENCLHGGDGFDHRMWTLVEAQDDRLVFSYDSYDGEEGFPSALSVKVSYILSGDALVIDYVATPDGKTPIALTNHAYFNLNGKGNIEGHRITVYADKYTEVGDDLIPTGNRPAVEGTVFDLRTERTIKDMLTPDFIGYDHNFMLCPGIFREFIGKELGLCATVKGDTVGMSVYTDQEGVQLYIGNFLGNGPDFKGGEKQVFHGALCLETQTEPNCINRGRGFYEAGQTYTHTAVYEFFKL